MTLVLLTTILVNVLTFNFLIILVLRFEVTIIKKIKHIQR